MPPVVKQTSRQVKAAYRKNGGSLSEREIRRLENLAAADRRAEELRAKEKQRAANKKKREEKERKDREARLANGIGDATQRAGWNFTQRRQKDWFRGYFAKAKQPAAANPSGADPHPPIYDSDNEYHENDLGDDKLRESNMSDQSIYPHETSDDSEASNDANESANARDTYIPQVDLAIETDPHDTDDCSDDGVAEAIQKVVRVKSLASDTDSGDETDPCHIPDDAPGFETDGHALIADTPVLDTGDPVPRTGEGALNIREAIPSTADERNLSEQDDSYDTDLDDDIMFELAQFELPTTEALFPLSDDLDDSLPAMETAFHADMTKPYTQVAQKIDTLHRQPHAISDLFSSSELDISAEDLAEIDAPPKSSPLSQAKPGPQAPITRTRTVTPKQSRLPSSPTSLARMKDSNPALSVSSRSMMPPPPKPVLKRKFDDSANTTLSNDKQRRSPNPRRRPKPTTPPLKPLARRVPFEHSAFASIGMSTQLIENNLSDDDDAILSSPVLDHPAVTTITSSSLPPPPSPPPLEDSGASWRDRHVSTAPVLSWQCSSHFADIGLSTQLICDAAWEDVVLSSP